MTQYYTATIDNQTVIQVIVAWHAIEMISLLLGNNKSIRLGGNNPKNGMILLNTNIVRMPFTTWNAIFNLHQMRMAFSVADSSKGMEDTSN